MQNITVQNRCQNVHQNVIRTSDLDRGHVSCSHILKWLLKAVTNEDLLIFILAYSYSVVVNICSLHRTVENFREAEISWSNTSSHNCLSPKISCWQRVKQADHIVVKRWTYNWTENWPICHRNIQPTVEILHDLRSTHLHVIAATVNGSSAELPRSLWQGSSLPVVIVIHPL